MDKSLDSPYQPSENLLYNKKQIEEMEAYEVPLVSEIKKMCKGLKENNSFDLL